MKVNPKWQRNLHRSSYCTSFYKSSPQRKPYTLAKTNNNLFSSSFLFSSQNLVDLAREKWQ